MSIKFDSLSKRTAPPRASAPGPRDSEVTHPSQPPLRGIERGAYLVIATPLLTVLAEFELKLECARTCDPNGASRHTLEHVIGELRGAATRAEELELWGGIDDIVKMTGRPKSTVTEWAQRHGDKMWCWKRSGVWAVDLQKFDAWYRTNEVTLERRRRESSDDSPTPEPPAGAASPTSMLEAA